MPHLRASFPVRAKLKHALKTRSGDLRGLHTDGSRPDLAANQAIQANIEATTDALLLNPEAFKADHCDRFIAQVITPVSAYNTLVVWGNLSQWIEVIKLTGLPKPIEEYRKAIHDVLLSEWINLNIYVKQTRR